MDKKGLTRKILMAIGFIACGIGGAVTAGELPDNVEKAKELLTRKDEDAPEEKTE